LQNSAAHRTTAWQGWWSKLGLDLPIVLALANRLWSLASGPITVFFVAGFLSAEQQGLFYAFASILSAQMMLELGLSQCLMTFVSHESAKLVFDQKKGITGDATALARVAGLMKFATVWYGVIAILFFIIVGAVGYAVLGKSPRAEWELPWILLVASTSINLLLTPCWVLIEGFQQLISLGTIRLISSVSSSLALWFMLYAKTGVMAPAVSSLIISLCGVVYIIGFRGKAILNCLKLPSTGAVNWWEEILPLQWKAAISWICSYLIFNVMTAVCYRFSTSVEAGYLGMSMQVGLAVHLLAMVWLTRQAPVFGSLAASGEYPALRQLFRKSVIRALQTAALGALGVIIMVAILKEYSKIGERFGSLLMIGILGFALTVNQAIQGITLYFRAQKAEPMLGIFITNALVALCLMPFAAYYLGGIGVSLVFLSTQIIATIWCWKMFPVWEKRYERAV
jgi:O-antigen/teichoic acid export membrane protein